VNGANKEMPAEICSSGHVGIYCMTTAIVEEAARNGCNGFAKSLETALETLLAAMPRDQQSLALKLSYEMAIAKEVPAAPRLRLVYSRD